VVSENPIAIEIIELGYASAKTPKPGSGGSLEELMASRNKSAAILNQLIWW
jgi:hypothetical protein